MRCRRCDLVLYALVKKVKDEIQFTETIGKCDLCGGTAERYFLLHGCIREYEADE
jgi:hypothetical protein